MEALEKDVRVLLTEASALPALAEHETWIAFIRKLEDASARAGHVGSYVGCLASADAEDERYQLAEGKLAMMRAEFEKIDSAMKMALAKATDAEFAAFVALPAVDGAAFSLEQARTDARYRMSGELEALASDLGPDGIIGWGRLYDVVSAKLSFTMTYPDGRSERVPMAQRRSLMADADRRVREAAFVQGNRAWEASADIVAAALNHIAGTRHVLSARRGIAHIHDVALHDAAISKRTLSAMMEAVQDGAPIARRGLLLKARAMGLPAVSWFDLEAPLAVGSTRRIPWNEGVGLIRQAFGRGYPALSRFFDETLSRRWVEAEPRKGKRPGAYCTRSDLVGEERVYMTYQGSFGDVSTLAHEVGHAFHSSLLVHERVLARQYPMTLAETASTFAENLLADGLLADPATPAAERALLLGEIAGDAAAFILDVPTRFFFETKFYDERKAGEVPASRLCALMAETQREMFGDALAPDAGDPWFWASKLHFFIPEIAFYNFPYTFGYLLSRALFAELKKQGAAFLPRYEAFLRASGRGKAHEVAKATLGKDLETPGFWREAIDTLIEPLDALERTVAATR